MTLSTGMQKISNTLVSRYSETEYSKDLCDTLISLVQSSRTTYTSQCYSTSEALSAGADFIRMLLNYVGEDAQVHSCFFPSDGQGGFVDGPTDPVDPVTVQIAIDLYGVSQTYPTSPILLDLEAYDPIHSNLAYGLPNLESAVKMWKEGTTGRPVGYYRIVPATEKNGEFVNFGAAVEAANATDMAKWQARISTWMKNNDIVAGTLLKYVDFLMPNVVVPTAYTLDQWKWLAGGRILEAIRLADGRPVYPYTWFYTQAGDVYTMMSEADYTTMLQFVASFPGVDGVMIFSGEDNPTQWTFTDVIYDLVNKTGAFQEVPP